MIVNAPKSIPNTTMKYIQAPRLVNTMILAYANSNGGRVIQTAREKAPPLSSEPYCRIHNTLNNTDAASDSARCARIRGEERHRGVPESLERVEPEVVRLGESPYQERGVCREEEGDEEQIDNVVMLRAHAIGLQPSQYRLTDHDCQSDQYVRQQRQCSVQPQRIENEPHYERVDTGRSHPPQSVFCDAVRVHRRVRPACRIYQTVDLTLGDSAPVTRWTAPLPASPARPSSSPKLS